MGQMRDDERYPIPVHEELPEVASQPAADYYANANEKYVVPRSDTLKDVVSPITPDVFDNRNVASAKPVARKPRTVCGIPRTKFWLIVVIVALLIVGAIVGGLIGGLKARASLSDTSSPPATTPTGTLAAKDRAIAASSTGAGTKQSTLQIFYQDVSTTNILYRLIWADKANQEKVVTFTIPPNQGTPLAVISSNSSSGNSVMVNLFYLSTDTTSSRKPIICQAMLECSQRGATCTTKYNRVVSGALTEEITPQTKLAALLLDGSSEYRVFFQVRSGWIWVLVAHSPTDTSPWGASQVGGPGISGTSIAASIEQTPFSINLLFVFNATGTLREIEYNDTLGPQGNRGFVDQTPGSRWNPDAGLAACYLPGQNTDHIYYVAPSTGEIVAYFRQNTSSKWLVNQDDHWTLADGGIAALAFNDQTRLLYMNNGRLTMSACDGTVWADFQYL